MHSLAAPGKMITILGLLGLSLLTSACTHQRGQADAQTKRELLALQDRWAEARIKGDVDFLEHFYAQEFRIQAMNGNVATRSEDIAMFDRVRRGDPNTITPQYIHDVDMGVSVYCDTAVVTGVENLKGTNRGVYGEMALRFTNLFVRRDGRWQLALHHSTPVQGK
jgi:ketosteroid isomerase-like protein